MVYGDGRTTATISDRETSTDRTKSDGIQRLTGEEDSAAGDETQVGNCRKRLTRGVSSRRRYDL